MESFYKNPKFIRKGGKQRKMRKELKILFAGIVTLLVFGIYSALLASNYPTRSIELISPNAPGGGMDFAANLFKNKVERILGQPIILNFKTGAAGVTGTVYAKSCKPDGYTLMLASISTLVISPLTKKGAGYNLDDFTPICTLTAIPLVFCVREDSPYKTMQDFIQAAKTKKIKYATHGAFTTAHICMEALGRMAGFQATHIPHTGAAAAMTASLGGHVDMAISATTAFVGPGRLRILTIAQEKRFEDYPDVPTLKELGYPLSGEITYSLWAPKGIPKEIVNRIYEAYKRALEENREEIIKVARGGEQTVLLLNGEELRKKYQGQYEFYKKTLGEIGMLIK
jgi:tripartite-type tricarboxylate transporter receptor subunit TctC